MTEDIDGFCNYVRNFIGHCLKCNGRYFYAETVYIFMLFRGSDNSLPIFWQNSKLLLSYCLFETYIFLCYSRQ